MKFRLNFEFEMDEHDCYDCDFCIGAYDANCLLQNEEFGCFKDQLKNCPLEIVEGGEDEV